MARFAGESKEAIIAWGDFLNYGITWDEAEGVFTQLSSEAVVSSAASGLFLLHQHLSEDVAALIPTMQ